MALWPSAAIEDCKFAAVTSSGTLRYPATPSLHLLAWFSNVVPTCSVLLALSVCEVRDGVLMTGYRTLALFFVFCNEHFVVNVRCRVNNF